MFWVMRHGESTLNVAGIVNGDPSVEVPLTPRGEEQCRAVAELLIDVDIAAAWCTRFGRTAASARLALPAGPEPRVIEDLDDVRLGVLEGAQVEDVRAWRRLHGLAARPEGGESRVDAARRYARGFAMLAEGSPTPALVVAHELPVRMLLTVLAGGNPLSASTRIGNAQPVALARDALAEGAARIASAR